MIELFENESIEDLQCGGYRLITAKDSFRFGTDAVLLAHFASFKRNARAADFGTGSGVMPILICARHPSVTFDAIEIQETAANRAERSVRLNGLESRIQVHHMDVRNLEEHFGRAVFDAVIANPPYGKLGQGPIPENEAEAIARFEHTLTLEGLMHSVFVGLKNGGRFFLVHRPDRMLEILDLARKYHLCPRLIRFVYPTEKHNPKLILCEFEKNGTAVLQFGRPFIIKDSAGAYTQEAAVIYDQGRTVLR